MQSFRSFSIGSNFVNDFNVQIDRVQKSQQSGNSRIPAKYFGRIFNPDGTLFKDLGTNGLNSKQIKLLIGQSLNPNPRTGLSSNNANIELRRLQTALIAMKAASLDTTDLEQKIADKQQAIEQEKQQAKANAKALKEQTKAIRQQIAKLEKAAKAMMQAGLDCEQIQEQINSLKNQI